MFHQKKICQLAFISLVSFQFFIGDVFAETKKIRLKPGYWAYTQNTEVQGGVMPGSNLSGGECLLETDGERALSHYIDKFEQGLGEDSKCTRANMTQVGNKVAFDLSCTGGEGFSSKHHIQYQYALDRVDIEASGQLSAFGHSLATKTIAVSTWKRACTEKEQGQAVASQVTPETRDFLIPSKAAKPVPQKPEERRAETKPKAKSQKRIQYLEAKHLQRDLRAIRTDKPILVHYTSTDGSCPHCMKNNVVFEKMFREQKDDYHFAQVVFNPWRSYQKGFKHLKGLPVTKLYDDKVEVASIIGHHEALPKLLQEQNTEIQSVLSADYSRVPIKRVDANELKKIIETSPAEKVLLVNISSNQDTCPACVKNNAFFRFGAKTYGSKFQFLEMIYEPYSAIKQDSELLTYLTSKKTKVAGLPTVLVFQKGQFIGKRDGVWSGIREDLEAFLAKK